MAARLGMYSQALRRCCGCVAAFFHSPGVKPGRGSKKPSNGVGKLSRSARGRMSASRETRYSAAPGFSEALGFCAMLR